MGSNNNKLRRINLVLIIQGLFYKFSLIRYYGMQFLPTSYPRHDHNFRHVMDFYRHVTDFYRQVIIFYRQVIFLPSQLHFYTVTTSFLYRHGFSFLPSQCHKYISSRHHVKHSKEKSSKKSQYKQE